MLKKTSRQVLMLIVLSMVGGTVPVSVADDPPSWAYPATPPVFERPKDTGARQRIVGSARSYTLTQLADAFNPPDWYPAEHGPMPDPVGKGHMPSIKACASCHLPNGQGFPQSANLAGLPTDYIAAQLNNFALGNRLPALGNLNIDMGTIARAMTPAEIRSASVYFSRLKVRPWIKVTEARAAPTTEIVEGDLVIQTADGGTEPLGTRIVEVPDAPARARLLDSHATYVAYVPVGALNRGRNLVRTGGAGVVGGRKVEGKTTECSKCHGLDYRGQPAKPDGTLLAPTLLGRSPSYTVRQLYDIQRGARKGPAVSDMKNVVAQLTLGDMIDIAAYLSSRMP